MTIEQQLTQLLANTNSRGYASAIKKHPGLWLFVNQLITNLKTKTISEALYCFNNNLLEIPKCKCGNLLKFNTYNLGYREYCSTTCIERRKDHSLLMKGYQNSITESRRKEMDKLRKQTCLQKYGAESHMQSPNFVKQLHDTNITKFGYKSAIERPEVINKIKQTCLEKYGVETPFQSSAIREKGQNSTIKKYSKLMTHARAGAYQKYNGINPFAAEEVKLTIQNSMMEKYGSPYFSQTEYFKSQVIDTVNDRYGRNNVAQLKQSDQVYNFLSDQTLFTDAVKGKTSAEVCLEFNIPSTDLIIHTARKFNILDSMIFNPKSAMEEHLAKSLSDLVINFKRNDRIIISPKELDFVIEDKKIAIELHGLYQHSEKFNKSVNYHYLKYEKTKSAGYELIQIYQDEFWQKHDIVMHIIKSKLSLLSPISIEFNIINDINIETETEFLNKHHILGFDSSRTNSIAVIDINNELIAIMSYKLFNNSVEILRYASIVGNDYSELFDQLLNAIISKNGSVLDIIAYSHNRFSDENLYQNSGFVFLEDISPDFKYTNYKNTFSKSSDDIDISSKYDKIWDCGRKKFIKHIK